MADTTYIRLLGAIDAIEDTLAKEDPLIKAIVYYAIGYRGFSVHNFSKQRESSYIKDVVGITDLSMNPTALLTMSIKGIGRMSELRNNSGPISAYAEIGAENGGMVLWNNEEWRKYMLALGLAIDQDVLMEDVRLAVEGKLAADLHTGVNRDRVGRLPNSGSTRSPEPSPLDYVQGAIGLWNTVFGGGSEEEGTAPTGDDPYEIFPPDNTPEYEPSDQWDNEEYVDEQEYDYGEGESESYDDWGYEPDDWYGGEAPTDYGDYDEADYNTWTSEDEEEPEWDESWFTD